MLIEFRVKNFRSFRDEQIFTMIASSDKDLPDNVAITPSIDHTPVVRSAVVLGANASGKSNLIAAMGAPFQQKYTISVYEPFLLDIEFSQKPSEFTYEIVVDNIRYKYKIEIDKTGVCLEELHSYPKKMPRLLFRRVKNKDKDGMFELKFSREFNKRLSILESDTPKYVLLLENAAFIKLEPFVKIWHWFQRISSVLTSIEMSASPDIYNKDNIESRLSQRFHKDSSLLKFAENLVRRADVGIFQIISRREKILDELESDYGDKLSIPAIYYLDLVHRTNGSTSQDVTLSFDQQSLGTRQLLYLSAPLYETLKYGNLFVIDELDKSLHPLLARTIIRLFNSPDVNRHNAQIIFNTHDATLLDTTLLRRDQIWFTEKGEDGASTLYPLTSFSPRRGEALARGYLLGRYGGIPYLGDNESLERIVNLMYDSEDSIKDRIEESQNNL